MNKFVFVVMSNGKKSTLFIKSKNKEKALNKLLENYKNVDEVLEVIPYDEYKVKKQERHIKPSTYYSYSYINQAYGSNKNILK